MQFVEAFERLGYKVDAPRQDWSAMKLNGVCITPWKKELRTQDGRLWMSTRDHAGPIEKWGDKAGNRKRISHLRRAVNELGDKVDVVIVSGEPGASYGTAQPWLSEGSRAGTFWEITAFEEESGHFEVQLRLQRSSVPQAE